MPPFSLTVNHTQHRLDADPDMPLLWALRDLLQLTGTKYGCGMGVCGACTVLENGTPVRSCQTPLSANGDHPCQKAWIEEDVSQCGYCQAGMIMQAAAFVRRKPSPTDQEIDAEMSDHVCRCGTYQRLRRAIRRAAREVSKT